MKRFIKDGQIKPRNQIVVVKDGLQYINPKDEVLLADGWEEYIEQSVDELQQLKENLRNDILTHDSSEMVNGFALNETHVWLDKATRAGLMFRFQAEQRKGKTEATLWYNGVMYTLPIESAFDMLMALEVYASQCYDNTQRHLANVEKLQTIEEVEAYDYTQGYPQQLEF